MYVYTKIYFSGTHFLLDLPVYCRSQGQLRIGEEDIRGLAGPVREEMTSSLLLRSLSPYLSADDSIDGLLLPDIEEFFSTT